MDKNNFRNLIKFTYVYVICISYLYTWRSSHFAKFEHVDLEKSLKNIFDMLWAVEI